MTNSNYTEILSKHLYTLIKEELEDGEDDQTKKYAEYDVVLVPENVNKAIEALSNIKNYGTYAQNLRDPKTIEKVFGPNTPATKGRVAKETWNKFSETEKRAKVLDIKSRASQDFASVETQLQPQFQTWSEENEGDFIDFLVSLPGDKLPMNFYGKYGANFFLTKTPENLKKYSGVMSKGVHYLANEDELTFPQNWNPFKSKDYLKKVLKLIMDNAGLEYVFSEQESTEQPKEKATSVTSPDRPDQINFVKTFTDDEGVPDEDLAAKFKKLIPDEFKFKTKVENGKVTVSDISASDKKALINASIKFQEKYNNLYENKNTMKDNLNSSNSRKNIIGNNDVWYPNAEEKYEEMLKTWGEEKANKTLLIYLKRIDPTLTSSDFFNIYNKLHENKHTMKDQLRSQLTSMIKEVLLEKKLTPAELKKRNKEAEVIKKKNPKMDKGEAFAIATKHLKEGEGETSMDDILDAFQAALSKEDDAEQDQALKAVYMALKDKVKGKLGQAADYAKDKLNKYNDSLEENV
jgi:hypothetical protein